MEVTCETDDKESRARYLTLARYTSAQTGIHSFDSAKHFLGILAKTYGLHVTPRCNPVYGEKPDKNMTYIHWFWYLGSLSSLEKAFLKSMFEIPLPIQHHHPHAAP